MSRSIESVNRSPIRAVALHVKTEAGWEEWDGGTRPLPDRSDYYAAPTGTLRAIPAGTQIMEIRAVTAVTYCKFGGVNLLAPLVAPTGNLEDVAPIVIPVGQAVRFPIPSDVTHWTVLSAGGVLVHRWGSFNEPVPPVEPGDGGGGEQVL